MKWKATSKGLFLGGLLILVLVEAPLNASELPAYVSVDFKTTVTVSDPYSTDAGAVVLAFAVDDNLYAAMDAQANPITEFGISDIKVLMPNANTSLNTSYSIRLAYRTAADGAAVPLLHVDNLTPSQIAGGAYVNIKASGLADLNNQLLTDIQQLPASRSLKKMFLVVKIKVQGPDASAVDLDGVDLDLTLSANAATSVNL